MINGLRHYGVRSDNIKKGRRISWSNNKQRWYDSGKPYRRIDANELNIPDITEKELSKIICCLDILPLFKYSFEYKQAHPDKEIDITLEWLKKQKELTESEQISIK